MRFNLRSLIQASIFLWLLPAVLVAQRYPFTSVTLKDGLPQSAIYAMVQDHQGYMWFSTGGGVCRYDGIEFKYYTYYSGFEAGHTQDIEIDNKGRIWVATFGKGLGLFDGNRFSCFDISRGFIYANIKNVHFSREGDLWLTAMDYSVVRIYNDTGLRIHWYEEIPGAFKSKKITELSDGDILVGGAKGYYRFDKQKNYKPNFVSMPSIIIKVVEDKKGGLWIAGRNIIYYQKGDSLIDHSHWLNTNIPTDVFDVLLPEDDGDFMYIATGIGVLKVKGDRVEMLTMENGLASDYAMVLYKDHFGNVWTGTGDGGSILNDRGMAHYEDDLNGGDLFSFTITEDTLGNVLVGKSLVGVIACNDTGYFQLPVKFPAPFDPQEMYRRPNGKLYALTNFKTIHRFNHNQIEWTWNLPDSMTRVNAFFPMKNGKDLLLGTSEGGFILNEENGRMTKVKNLAVTSFVNAFYDDNDDLWFTADLGYVFKIRNGVAQDMTDVINPEREIIKHSLYDHFHHTIWLGTERGVLAWNGTTTYKITTKNGLGSNLQYCITLDSTGRIWTGNLQGVDCIDVDKMKISHYGYEQGFLPIETNGRAALTDSKGNVWIGAVNATSKIKVKELGKDTIEGILRLQSIDVNEEEWYSENYYDSVLPKVNLKHDMNNLVFHVASICFTNAKNTLYEWKLEGLDKHWNKKINHREIEYSNLPPGEYKLRVKAINPDGFETNEIVLPVYIAKPFWQTGIFYASEVAIFLLVVYLSFRFSRSSKNRFGQVMTLLTILIVFESIMLYISNYTDEYTHGIPVFQLVMNIVLAASLYPLEQRIKRVMQKRARKK